MSIILLIEKTLSQERLRDLSQKIKVIFFIYQMGAGGAARTMLNILNNIDNNKFEPILVTLNYDGSYEPYLHSDIRFIKLNSKRLRSAIIPLAKLMRQERADIIFSTIPNYNVVVIIAKLLSFTKTKIIVREAAFLGGSWKKNIQLLIYGLFYRFASKVVSLSNGVKKNLVKRYKVNPEKIEVIYNPIDLNSIQDSVLHGVIAKEHQSIFQSNAKVVMTAGRLVADKDQETLLEAFVKLNRKLKSELVILGEGELEVELQLKARRLNIDHKVHLIGFQRNPYIYFAEANVFVLTSKREGFGHVLVEALATETPVVSTKAKPGAEEVLANGLYGELCEVGNPDDIAKKLYDVLSLNNVELTQRIEKGLQRTKEFDAKIIVKQYEEMFIQVINQEEMLEKKRRG